MKIGPLDKPPVATAPADRKSAPAAGKTVTVASAQVALSPAAQDLAGSTDGSFDASKVDGIAQAIRNGQYKVNPEAIADKLISNAAELLGRKAS